MKLREYLAKIADVTPEMIAADPLLAAYSSVIWNGAIDQAIEAAQNISVLPGKAPVQEMLSRQKMAILDELRKLKDVS